MRIQCKAVPDAHVASVSAIDSSAPRFFERVGSKDNIADEPSRNEFRGLQYFGAELVDAVLPAQLRDSSSWASGQLAFEK
jgi:hypothetical protein